MNIHDPRDPRRRQTKYTHGRNSESFDPKSTFVRPDMRIVHESNTRRYTRPLKHDDVCIVPEFEQEQLKRCCKKCMCCNAKKADASTYLDTKAATYS